MAHCVTAPTSCPASGGGGLGWSAEPDLVAEELACRRGERLVFAGLSFRLPAGGALLLTGANGSGKTSLLRLLATLIEPAAGRLLWGDAPIEADMPGLSQRGCTMSAIRMASSQG